MNKYIVYFLLALSIFLSKITISQKSEILQEHYKNEFQTFKEFIAASIKYKGDTNIDVKFYYLDIFIGIESPYIEGNVTCWFEPVSENLETVRLDLNSSLTVDHISLPCESFYRDGDKIIIQLDDSYNPGDKLNLSITYHGVPVLAGGYKGLRYANHHGNQPIIATLSTPYLAHYWYPCKDGPQDKADSVYVDITIADSVIMGVEMMAVSNGLLENIIDNGDTKTYQWRHRYPIVTYYVMAAVSNFVHFQDMFAGTSGEAFPLDYYVFEDDLNISQQGVELLPDVMQFFSDVFGTYPFSNEKYGMTQLGFYGAIENQTNTIINNMSLSWFDVTVHELGHMWFGDMITCADWHHGWLNEGFATYSEALWDEHKYGTDAYFSNMSGNQYWQGGTLYLQNAQDTFNIFQSIIYSKGAYVLHMLRGVLGDDLFFEGILNYAQHPDFIYKNADTEDMQSVFEAVSGMNLAFFFDQWIYDEYFPIYRYNFAQNTANTLFVTIYQAQEELYNRRPVFEMPVQLLIHFQDGTDTLVSVWNNEQTQDFGFDFEKQVSGLEFDPKKWILRQAQYDPGIPVGAGERKLNSISLYPNPGRDFITVDAGHKPEKLTVELMSMNGKILLRKTWKQEQKALINLKELAPGIYFTRVRMDEAVSLFKVIKKDH